MHQKRYNKLSENLYKTAIRECFKGKWSRRDILSFIEKYAGIPREEILLSEITGSGAKDEAVDAIALALQEIVEELIAGHEPADHIEPVRIRTRPDGMTGKLRDIALLCILHQLLGHLAKLMLEPLFNARLLPTQHASIPEHGQTRLMRQTHGYLLQESIGIKYVQKTDVVHAYESLKYEICINLIIKELPKEKELHIIMRYLEKLAPDGHLIIGGYLDAWLFNFTMSYAIRYLYTLGQTRRGKFTPYVKKCETFMDDFSIMTASCKGMKKATAELGKWTQRELGLQLKYTTGVTKMLPVEEEQRRRYLKSKAARGVPVLDMAGFKISRTHVCIRRRVFIRVRRQYLRAYEEYMTTGTLRLFRAKKIISYNSYFVQTDSRMAAEKYHAEMMMNIAREICAFYERLRYNKRMEELYALLERRGGIITEKSNGGSITGWKDAGKTGRQHQKKQGSGNRADNLSV